jgi:hypothetical protein
MVSSAATVTEITEHFPPMAPDSEELVLPSDPEFERACLVSVSHMAEKQKWRYKNSILTRSEKWGLIWRVDFEILDSYHSGSAVNRIIFFKLPDARLDEAASGICTAFGQRVKPL